MKIDFIKKIKKRIIDRKFILVAAIFICIILVLNSVNQLMEPNCTSCLKITLWPFPRYSLKSSSSIRAFPYCCEWRIFMFWNAESSSYTSWSMSYSTSRSSVVGQYRSTSAPRMRAGSLGVEGGRHEESTSLPRGSGHEMHTPPDSYLLIRVILPFSRAFSFDSSAFKSCGGNATTTRVRKISKIVIIWSEIAI